MKEHTREVILKYLGDECKWPFVWDGTMGAKYVVGSAYFRIKAAVREGYDEILVTRYGFKLQKSDGGKVSAEPPQGPSDEFIEALDLIRSRDRLVRRIVSKVSETTTPLGREILYAVDPEAFERAAERAAYGPPPQAEVDDKRVRPPASRRTHIPLRARAQAASIADDYLRVVLEDGRIIMAPLAWFPRLASASPVDRGVCEVVGGGLGLFWPQLDEDILVASLLVAYED